MDSHSSNKLFQTASLIGVILPCMKLQKNYPLGTCCSTIYANSVFHSCGKNQIFTSLIQPSSTQLHTSTKVDAWIAS